MAVDTEQWKMWHTWNAKFENTGGENMLSQAGRVKASKVAWPSGLRRWFKAPVSSEAWVRIPPLPRTFKSHTLRAWRHGLRKRYSYPQIDRGNALPVPRTTALPPPSTDGHFCPSILTAHQAAVLQAAIPLYAQHSSSWYKVVWPSGLRRWF